MTAVVVQLSRENRGFGQRSSSCSEIPRMWAMLRYAKADVRPIGGFAMSAKFNVEHTEFDLDTSLIVERWRVLRFALVHGVANG